MRRSDGKRPSGVSGSLLVSRYTRERTWWCFRDSRPYRSRSRLLLGVGASADDHCPVGSPNVCPTGQYCGADFNMADASCPVAGRCRSVAIGGPRRDARPARAIRCACSAPRACCSPTEARTPPVVTIAGSPSTRVIGLRAAALCWPAQTGSHTAGAIAADRPQSRSTRRHLQPRARQRRAHSAHEGALHPVRAPLGDPDRAGAAGEAWRPHWRRRELRSGWFETHSLLSLHAGDASHLAPTTSPPMRRLRVRGGHLVDSLSMRCNEANADGGPAATIAYVSDNVALPRPSRIGHFAPPQRYARERGVKDLRPGYARAGCRGAPPPPRRAARRLLVGCRARA